MLQEGNHTVAGAGCPEMPKEKLEWKKRSLAEQTALAGSQEGWGGKGVLEEGASLSGRLQGDLGAIQGENQKGQRPRRTYFRHYYKR